MTSDSRLTTVEPPQLRADDVARYAQLTYRELSYWVETGLLRSQEYRPGTGNARTFTQHEAEILRAAQRLRRLGFELAAIRRLVREKDAEKLSALVDRVERALV